MPAFISEIRQPVHKPSAHRLQSPDGPFRVDVKCSRGVRAGEGREGKKPRPLHSLDLLDPCFDPTKTYSEAQHASYVRSCVSTASVPQPRPRFVPDWPAFEVSSPFSMPRQATTHRLQYNWLPERATTPVRSGKRDESYEEPTHDQ